MCAHMAAIRSEAPSPVFSYLRSPLPYTYQHTQRARSASWHSSSWQGLGRILSSQRIAPTRWAVVGTCQWWQRRSLSLAGPRRGHWAGQFLLMLACHVQVTSARAPLPWVPATPWEILAPMHLCLMHLRYLLMSLQLSLLIKK